MRSRLVMFVALLGCNEILGIHDFAPPPPIFDSGFDGIGPGMDGSGSSGSGSPGIGTVCTGSGAGDPGLCPASAPECLPLGITSSPAFQCTSFCGIGPCAAGGSAGTPNCFENGSSFAPPPQNGQAMCVGVGTADHDGTPACFAGSVLPTTNCNGSGEPPCGTIGAGVQWACIVLCGTVGGSGAGGSNFGSCPPGLTCMTNVCQ